MNSPDTVLQIFHNPRCSKSREALALLQARGLQPQLIDYLNQPPDVAALRQLLGRLGLPARALLRDSEAEYEALGLARTTLDEAALLAAIAAHPRLLQRPIVVQGQRALIARPPALLEDWLR